nr:PglZ domain-containing protein [Saprospiraceae bacterium]
MSNTTILWADDEIDLLKAQILYLNERGYDVKAVTNGQDALEEIRSQHFDVVFLDESMPGLTGLETLSKIKEINANVPVVMITKNEEENLMDEAIGSQIDDYLIKPVKPQQIVLTLKKLTDNKRLITQKTTSSYQQAFQQLFMAMSSNDSAEDWMETYKKLIYWELQLQASGDTGMDEVLVMQKQEANSEFSKFITRNYTHWLNTPSEAPTMSHNLLKNHVFPLIDATPTFLIVIDNLRYDQWRTIEPLVSEYFRLKTEDTFFSILPTSTQYSRNAIFAGIPPSEIERKYPQWWVNDEEPKGKNLYEKQLLNEHIRRSHLDIKFSYNKITNNTKGKELEDNILNLMTNSLNVIVYNFVDMLSHARTEMEVLKELASDENAYRSLTRSWFEHSPLFAALKKLAGRKVRIVFTTDHGTVRVKRPVKVVGDKNTTTNLRYKTGKNLNYNPKEVYEIKDPSKGYLPRQHVSSTFIFARDNDFLVYPNNYNHFVKYYKDTFQHG